MNTVNKDKVSVVSFPDKDGNMTYTGCIAYYARITPTEELSPEEIRDRLLRMLNQEIYGE